MIILLSPEKPTLEQGRDARLPRPAELYSRAGRLPLL